MTESEYLLELQHELSQKQTINSCRECEFAVFTENNITCIFRGNNPLNDCRVLKEYLNL